jgi:tetratricopeptide (TPR) repeat protein
VAGPKQWGSLGRRGAGRLREDRVDSRNAAGAQARDDRPDPGNRPVVWERVDDGEVRGEAAGAVGRGRTAAAGPKRGGPRPQPSADRGLEPKEKRGRAPRAPGAGTGGAQARDELVRALGAGRGAKANERLRDAAHAFERERNEEARTLLRPLAAAAPQAAAVRELLGLTYYRLGKWSDALRELGAFREQTRSTEQHPVLADCNRALKRHREVEELWEELREASPAPDLVTEGRIVMAGSLADRKRLGEAIELLERSQRSVKRAQVHHLRQAYVLADLYEQGGDVARARELFRWILAHDAGFADAAERASSLG